LLGDKAFDSNNITDDANRLVANPASKRAQDSETSDSPHWWPDESIKKLEKKLEAGRIGI